MTSIKDTVNTIYHKWYETTMMLVLMFQIGIVISEVILLSNLPCDIASIRQQIAAAVRHYDKTKRISFTDFASKLDNRQFQLMFRMDQKCFELLCSKIEQAVGEREFKSEKYLDQLYNSNTKEAQMYRANIKTTGGYISGEVKVAVGLRILAGASYLDVACIFGIHYCHVQTIFRECVKDWFSCNEVSPLILDDALQNEDDLSFQANIKVFILTLIELKQHCANGIKVFILQHRFTSS
jgi:hypothetical protein